MNIYYIKIDLEKKDLNFLQQVIEEKRLKWCFSEKQLSKIVEGK